MKIIVCGGRDYEDRTYLFRFLKTYCQKNSVTIIVHGAAGGADSMAGEFAKEFGINEVRMPADWAKHGRSAGPIRNRQMLALNPDAVIAFPGGRGTGHMVGIARARGIPVIEPVKDTTEVL